jgi:hypothetical protein
VSSVARRFGSERLAAILADRIRLFAEVLAVIAAGPLTVDEVDERIRTLYKQSWRNTGNTRMRMEWHEVLGLIEAAGNRRWALTPAGRTLLVGRALVGAGCLRRTLRTWP